MPLIRAAKIPALERLYAAYGRRLLRRSFARIACGGSEWPGGDGPAIGFLNHAAWWDPILAVFLSHHVFGRDGYGIMQGAQLVAHPFFRRVGCFGITDSTSVDEVRQLAEYARELLNGGARRTLWIFPQGELLPSRTPLAFRSGLARLARAVPDAPLVPIAVRYELGAAQWPEIVLRVGASVRARDVAGGAGALTRVLAQSLTSTLTALDDDLLRGATGSYRSVLVGRRSISERWRADRR